MYNWIETTFNVSGGVTQAIAVILALAVVLVLFALFIFILKRLTGGQVTQNRNRQPRIAVMDSATIDTRRRLVLIRRDNIEHLLLIGGPSDVVVEQNIVRNTPLTPQRSSNAHSLAGQAPVKGPMAPGPDIPARPDDLVALNEPPQPPVVQARPPSTASTPVPPEPPQSPSAPPPASRVASPKPEPHPPAPEEPKFAPPPTVAAAGTPASGPDTGGGLNRAADLLRAAKQNGFNKTVAKTPAPEPAPVITPPPPAAASHTPTGETAPEVRPAAKPADTAGAQADSKTGSALKSLARPFSPRDRPSYGNQSITPPASGPAARAKTALLKPLEAGPEQNKVEPVLTTIPAEDAPRAISGAVNPETLPESEQPDRTSLTDTAPAVDTSVRLPLSAPTSADRGFDPDNTAPPDKAAAESSLAQSPSLLNRPESKDLQASQEASPEQAAPDFAPESTLETAPEPAPDPARDITSASDKTPDISLDMSDLLEEELPSTNIAQSDAEQSGTRDGRKEDAKTERPAQDQSQISEVRQDTTGAEGRKQNHVQKAGLQATSGLGDKNPIEDEMAKILDELGGQPN